MYVLYRKRNRTDKESEKILTHVVGTILFVLEQRSIEIMIRKN